MNEVSQDSKLLQSMQTVEYDTVTAKDKTPLYARAWNGFFGGEGAKYNVFLCSLLGKCNKRTCLPVCFCMLPLALEAHKDQVTCRSLWKRNWAAVSLFVHSECCIMCINDLFKK